MANKLAALPGCIVMGATMAAACLMLFGLFISGANSLTLYVVGILGAAILVFCLFYLIKKAREPEYSDLLTLDIDQDKGRENSRTKNPIQ
jgi:phosphotransferase system  glucose/maltose/N-acetylglucosamine-specific IIC component